MSEEKVIALLGFANKAGKLAIGRSAVEAVNIKGRVYAVLVATDASDKIEKIVENVNKETFRCCSKEALGQILGRTEVAIIGILDQGFVKSIRQAMKL